MLVVEFSCFSVCGVVEVAVLTVTVTSEAHRPGTSAIDGRTGKEYEYMRLSTRT